MLASNFTVWTDEGSATQRLTDKEGANDASATHTTCPWKGVASYYDVVVDGQVNKDAAWYYPIPKPLDLAVEAANRAFQSWRFNEAGRREALSACAGLLRSSPEEIGRIHPKIPFGGAKQSGYGGVLVAGKRAMVDGSTIGLLLGKPDSSFTNSRVLMTGRHAIAFGAAMGLAFALSSALLRRRQRP